MRRLVTALVVAAVAGIVATLAACDRTVAGGSTDGATVFRAACASCHGERGKPPQQMAAQLGVRDLTGAEFRARRDRATIEGQVRKGSGNGRMPGFEGALTAAQIEAVTAYVLTLGD
ncbi:MAG: c-type cytochrome [Kofleriaceae bacterium]|nr:c-type cytochrome [Kofleriaceae bacterium]MCL4227737.1 c-type cytochrome [Myxococcales bacterium]